MQQITLHSASRLWNLACSLSSFKLSGDKWPYFPGFAFQTRKVRTWTFYVEITIDLSLSGRREPLLQTSKRLLKSILQSYFMLLMKKTPGKSKHFWVAKISWLRRVHIASGRTKKGEKGWKSVLGGRETQCFGDAMYLWCASKSLELLDPVPIPPPSPFPVLLEDSLKHLQYSQNECCIFSLLVHGYTETFIPFMITSSYSCYFFANVPLSLLRQSWTWGVAIIETRPRRDNSARTHPI